MNRVGQVFMFKDGTWALVTESDQPTRRPGSATPFDHPGKQAADLPVHTLAVFDRSGAVHWPVERREDSLASWDQVPGRRLA